MIEGVQGTIQIEEEEDERLLTDILRAMYTSKLTITSTEDIVPLLLLAKKYEVASWVQQLDDHLAKNINATNALQCLHIDLEQHDKVKQSFNAYASQHANEILEKKSYVSLNEQLMSVMLGMLVNNNNQLQGFKAVQYWIDHDEEQRGGYCYALCKLVRSANKPPIYNGVTFQPQYCGSNAQLSNENKRIKRIGIGWGWDCAALGTKCTRYKICLVNNCNSVMIGFATTAFNKEGNNICSANGGFYMHLADGALYCKDRNQSRSSYHTQCYTNGTTIEAILENNTIRYVVNGTVLPVAFENVTGDLYPAFDIYDPRCEFEFVQ
jgi:hypothetical protein